MHDLLAQLLKNVGPEATQAISAQFDVPAEKAEQALPTVAPALLSQFSSMLDQPEQHVGTLMSLQKAFGGAQPEAPAGGMNQLLESVLGDKMAPLLGQLSGVLGTSTGTSRGIVQSIFPMVLGYFNKESAQGASIVGMLAPLLGGNSDKLKMLEGLLNTTDGADDLLGTAGKMLGGLFGKG
ncbi:MAG: DUF937 domain-containing protein [Bacteroidota bacterium]